MNVESVIWWRSWFLFVFNPGVVARKAKSHSDTVKKWTTNRRNIVKFERWRENKDTSKKYPWRQCSDQRRINQIFMWSISQIAKFLDNSIFPKTLQYLKIGIELVQINIAVRRNENLYESKSDWEASLWENRKRKGREEKTQRKERDSKTGWDTERALGAVDTLRK